MMSYEERKQASEDVRNGKRRTHSPTVGDGVDWTLKSMEIAERENELPQYADYPETLLHILKEFVRVFRFPERQVPYKNQKSTYELWVKQLIDLQELCGESYKEAFSRTKSKMDSMGGFGFVMRPLSIKTHLIQVLREMKEEEEEIKNSISTNKVPQNFVSPDDEAMLSLNKLKHRLRGKSRD